MARGGEYVQARKEVAKQEQVGGGIRGDVTEFSDQSRRRMFKWLAQLDRSKILCPPLFVTLTYPGGDVDHWAPYAKHHKRHLDALLKRFERFSSNAFILWRLEPQKRGAPHYHLLVFNLPHLPMELVAQWWWEIVGSGDADHLKAGTSVEGCKSWRGAAYYVAKYLGKIPVPESLSTNAIQLWDKPGRFWGVRNRKHVPISLEVYEVEPDKGFYQVRRIMRGAGKSKGYRLASRETVTLFLSDKSALRMLGWCGAWLEEPPPLGAPLHICDVPSST